MILFDLIVSQNTLGLSKNLALDYKRASVFSKSYNSLIKSFPVAYTVKHSEVLTEPKVNLANRNFIQRNYWQKIFNHIWRQVVFLSIPSKSYSKYVIELNYLNTRRDQSINKRLISKFSRALLEGSVASCVSTDSIDASSVSSAQYLWRQSLKLKQERLLSIFTNNPYQDHLKRAKNYLAHNTFVDHFPLFAVSNYLGQMIISEPPNHLGKNIAMFEYRQSKLHSSQLYQAWFFISFQDAQEYMSSIADHYDLQKDHLRISTCTFSTFYDVVDKFGHKVHFRLLPDLQEVSDMVKRYRNYRNISFHENQGCSSTYFQGQPLYMLKTKNGCHNYYGTSNLKDLGKYDLLFTNYTTACNVLNKITDRSLSSTKLQIPSLLVYNLESFLKDEFLKDDSSNLFLLVPSENTYWLTKKHFLEQKATLVNDAVSSSLSSVRLWSKRVLWSLTSKQPTL